MVFTKPSSVTSHLSPTNEISKQLTKISERIMRTLQILLCWMKEHMKNLHPEWNSLNMLPRQHLLFLPLILIKPFNTINTRMNLQYSTYIIHASIHQNWSYLMFLQSCLPFERKKTIVCSKLNFEHTNCLLFRDNQFRLLWYRITHTPISSPSSRLITA